MEKDILEKFYIGYLDDKDATATLYLDGTLEINGDENDIMLDLSRIPYKRYPDLIKRITFHPDNKLVNLNNLSELFLNFYYVKEIDFRYFKSKKIKATYKMFAGCMSLTKIKYFNKLDMSNVVNAEGMFSNCTNLKRINKIFNCKKLRIIDSMFYGCRSLEEIDLSSITLTGNIEYLGNIFTDCQELKKIKLFDLDEIRRSSIADMRNIFSGCESLEEIDLSNFHDLYNLNKLVSLFDRCYRLKEIDLSMIKSLKPLNIRNICERCVSLKYADFSNMIISHNVESIFKNCYKLKEINFTNTYFENIYSLNESFYYCMNLKRLDNIQFRNTNNTLTNISYMCSYCISLEKIFDIERLIINNKESLRYYNNIFFACERLYDFKFNIPIILRDFNVIREKLEDFNIDNSNSIKYDTAKYIYWDRIALFNKFIEKANYILEKSKINVVLFLDYELVITDIRIYDYDTRKLLSNNGKVLRNKEAIDWVYNEALIKNIDNCYCGCDLNETKEFDDLYKGVCNYYER